MLTIKKLLKENTKNKLIVCGDFWIVEINDFLYFFYTPNHFWTKIDKKKIENQLNCLTTSCVKFENFQPSDSTNSQIFEYFGYNCEAYSAPEFYNSFFDKKIHILTYDDNIAVLMDDGSVRVGNINWLTTDQINFLLSANSETNLEYKFLSIYEHRCLSDIQLKIEANISIGPIIGDITGSKYELGLPLPAENVDLFPKGADFTDDTVLTLAIAYSLLNKVSYLKAVRLFAKKYPNRGYGGMFQNWIKSSDPKPYYSFGNGAAMRVSPIAFAFKDLDTVLEEAKKSAEITHSHPEGIKGAQAIATAVFLAFNGENKDYILNFIKKQFNYHLDFKIKDIWSIKIPSARADNSVPFAIRAFYESEDFESALKLAISLGGDADTLASMTGAIAAAYYKNIPEKLIKLANNILPNELIDILNRFEKTFISKK